MFIQQETNLSLAGRRVNEYRPPSPSQEKITISQLFPIFIVANAIPLAQEPPVKETAKESATTKDEFARFSALIGAGFSGLSAGFGYNVNEKLNFAGVSVLIKKSSRGCQ